MEHYEETIDSKLEAQVKLLKKSIDATDEENK